MIDERYELAAGRIRDIRTEETVKPPFREYFRKMADFIGMIDEVRTKLADGTCREMGADELAEWNRRLEDLEKMAEGLPLCKACFDGVYPMDCGGV